jgi:hypothetical protein
VFDMVDATRTPSIDGPSARGLAAAEMPSREGSARSGLQVTLETCRLLLCREFEHDRQGPRPVLGRVSTWTVVVPVEAILYVARQANVVAVCIDVAPKDIDEALADTAHAAGSAQTGPVGCASFFRETPANAQRAKGRYADSAMGGRIGWQKPPSVPGGRASEMSIRYGDAVGFGFESGAGGPPLRLRRFGETDFACRSLAWGRQTGRAVALLPA